MYERHKRLQHLQQKRPVGALCHDHGGLETQLESGANQLTRRVQDRQHDGVNLVPTVGGHYALIAIGFANIVQLMRNNG